MIFLNSEQIFGGRRILLNSEKKEEGKKQILLGIQNKGQGNRYIIKMH